jgi:GNAT superfamily N-acetyltransferase
METENFGGSILRLLSLLTLLKMGGVWVGRLTAMGLSDMRQRHKQSGAERCAHWNYEHSENVAEWSLQGPGPTPKVVRVAGLRLWQQAHRLNRMARKESWEARSLDFPWFHRLDRRYFTVYLLLVDGKPVGYAAWNLFDDGVPVLRQLYIVPEKRRKGYGSRLLVESWRMFKPTEMFYVESPSNATLNMLVKLGFAKRGEDGCVYGVKVMFVSGG